jgi:hypothetical protein
MKLLLCLFLLGMVVTARSQQRPVNYDETNVPAYKLPDPLVCSDGTKVTDVAAWQGKRRPEILKLFQQEMHGISLGRPAEMQWETANCDKAALGGLATRKEITVWFGAQKSGPPMHILLYTPNAAKQPAPVFVSVNFDGNHTVSAEPGITITEQWTQDRKTKQEKLVRPDEKTRGQSIGRWEVEKLMARGYALATIQRADLEPDYPEGWRHGIRGFLLEKSGQKEFAPDAWGAIGAWAWGLSRTLDVLEQDKAVDAKRAVVIGHSRMGKAALWAGAQDERFAVVISNDSGEGGAALARRCFGETTAVINKSFPHWFCGNFKKYADKEDTLPFDQHELLALVAPRPLYVASAIEDRWADPKGEFLSALHAEPVWKLFGLPGLGVRDWPAVDQPVGATIGYHVRTGKHDVTAYDWEQYLNFADKHMGEKK